MKSFVFGQVFSLLWVAGRWGGGGGVKSVRNFYPNIPRLKKEGSSSHKQVINTSLLRETGSRWLLYLIQIDVSTTKQVPKLWSLACLNWGSMRIAEGKY